MITGVEIDFVVKDSREALALYERIFDAEIVEATDYARGSNEAVFTIYGTRFHLLDENPDFMLTAPKEGDPKPMWLNIAVPDIHAVYDAAMNDGCTGIQPPTDMEAMGVTNAMFCDPFGYIWMLHQIHRVVSFEERCQILEEQNGAVK